MQMRRLTKLRRLARGNHGKPSHRATSAAHTVFTGKNYVVCATSCPQERVGGVKVQNTANIVQR